MDQCTHPNTTQHILTPHPTPTQVTPSRFELGREVTKVFNGKLFRCQIEWIDSDDDNGELLYAVVYEDDDREDASWSSKMWGSIDP